MVRKFEAGDIGMAHLQGLEVWEFDGRNWSNITQQWIFGEKPHWFWEVTGIIDNKGSYWVPSSTTPPWRDIAIPLKDAKREPFYTKEGKPVYRPSGIYIWIPSTAFLSRPHLKLEDNPRGVDATPPDVYPPQYLTGQEFDTITPAQALLNEVLAAPPDQTTFQDSDGLISFVNLSSSFVTGKSEFKTGREICDKVSNFFATLREPVFSFLVKNPSKVLKGDTPPTTKWDPAVTHYMQFLLTQAGGLTTFHVTSEFYSNTQVIAEFSTEFIKLIFDAATVPAGIIGSVVTFIQGVGQSLRASWDDRSRNYQTAILGQCHEAVPVDKTGGAYVYYPKIKYYYLSVDSSQQAFTSDCATVRKITFDFRYESYVTGLKASVLDNTSDDYKSFVDFLDQAQGKSYEDARNNLKDILNGVPSLNPDEVEVDLQAYPPVSIKDASGSNELKAIEVIINTRVA